MPKDLVVHSFYIGGLEKGDLDKIAALQKILDKKLSIHDNTLDIKKLAYYCNCTELQARQYITYIESNVYYQRKFIIINGEKEYQTIDAIRATAIQERATSGNK